MEKLQEIKRVTLQKEKTIPLLWTVIITLAASITLNLSALFSALSGEFLGEETAALLLALSIAVSFIFVPRIFYKKILDFETKDRWNYSFIFLYAVIFLIMLQFTDVYMIIHFLAIGIGEEYLFRKLHFDYLEGKISTRGKVFN